MNHYILKGKEPVPVDLMTWARWFETADRKVAVDAVTDLITVSTVFLGNDHQLGEGPPLLFETMIFGGANDQWCERCSTWDEAEAQHQRGIAAAT